MLDALCRERERERERKRKNERKGRDEDRRSASSACPSSCARRHKRVRRKNCGVHFRLLLLYTGFLVVLWRSAFDVPLLLFLEQTFNDGKEWCFVYHGFVVFPLQRPRLSVRVHSFRLLPRLRVDQRRRSRVVRPRDDRTG